MNSVMAEDDYARDEKAAMDELDASPGDTITTVIEGSIRQSDYPDPSGYRIMIEPIEIEESTKSGLILTQQSLEAKEHLRHIGRVVKMGPLAYRHDKFRISPDREPEPWCRVGDWVSYRNYAGADLPIMRADGKGHKPVLFINDDEVICTIPNPHAVRIYV